MIFSPYGNYRIRLFDNIIVVTVYGSFKKSNSINLIRELYNVVNGLIDKDWAVIIDLRHWDLAPPDILDPILKSVAKLGCNRPDYDLIYIIENRIHKSFIDCHYSLRDFSDHKYTETLEEAFGILSDCGYENYHFPSVS